MQELIQQLIDKAGLSSEQAGKSVGVVKDFVKDKFPMLGDAVDKMMGGAAPTAAAGVAGAAAEGGSMLDKISDVIPGQVGEKVEDFVKGAADKLGGIFGK